MMKIVCRCVFLFVFASFFRGSTSGQVVLYQPRLIKPQIADFTNALHTHANAANGGQLNLTAAVSGILPGANGGTGTAFFAVAGPATSLKTFTFPNVSATVLTTNAAVTVAQGGTGIATGTSGGIPYFSASTTIASSAALTANLPVIGGGAGVAPSVGTRSGNTTQFVTTTGAQTSGRCVEIDANGNHVEAAAACGSGSGTVTSVAQSFTGGLISVAGSPITTSGTLALTVAGTSGGIPYFDSASSWASSSALTANLPVIGGGAGVAPSVGTRSGNTTQYVTTTGTQTNGDCVKIDANGNHVANGSACGGGTLTVKEIDGSPDVSGVTTLRVSNGTLTDDTGGQVTVTTGGGGGAPADATYITQTANGTLSNEQALSALSTGIVKVTTATGVLSSLAIPLTVDNGGTGLATGTSGGIPYFSASTTIASSGALTANLPVIGGGAGSAPTVGTRSGNTTTFATTTGTLTSGNCAKFDVNGNIVDHGSACGGGGGITNGSSLGSGSLGDAKFLTTDDRLYMHNGTNWSLAENPGWPRRDGSDDEEWESTNADPPTGWTWTNQNSTNDNEHGTRKSFLVLDRSSNAASHSILRKNVPASPQKTYAANLRWGNDLTGSGNNTQVGIVARNNTNGKLLVFVIAANPTPILYVSQWNDESTFSAISFSAALQPAFALGSYAVMAFTYDGTNLVFKYAPYHNGGEAELVTVYSEAVATHLGSFDSYGLTFYKNSGTTNSLWVDWIRVF